MKYCFDFSFYSCVKYLKSEMQVNPLIMNNIEDPLIRALDSEFQTAPGMLKYVLNNPKKISELFEFALFRTKTSDLPSFVSIGTSLPIFVGTDSPFPKPKDFGINDEALNSGRPVVYMQTYFKFAFVPGSFESLHLLRSLGFTNDFPMRSTLLVRKILEYK